MKILLTGKNGQVGFELQRALAPLGAVVAVGCGSRASRMGGHSSSWYRQPTHLRQQKM